MILRKLKNNIFIIFINIFILNMITKADIYACLLTEFP